jgi:hypothetical protein
MAALVERLARIQSMPAFDPKSFETAVKDATGLNAPSRTACSLLERA